MAGAAHGFPVPLLAAPAKALGIDQAGARATTAFIFDHLSHSKKSGCGKRPF
jgi:hypothetical protein